MSDSDEEAAPAAAEPRCSTRGCNGIAVFAAARGSAPSKCDLHRSDDAVDTRVLECEQQGCTRRPLYGTVAGKVRFCALHKVSKLCISMVLYRLHCGSTHGENGIG
jgi:EsV-1-7 cysteine-rich motif